MAGSVDRLRTGVAGIVWCWAVMLAVLANVGASAASASDGWSISEPYADNPLREASVAGNVRVGDVTEPSALTIRCRADDSDAVMTASFEVPDTLDFPFDIFEGPGAAGEKEALLTVTVGDGGPTAYNVSGWYSDAGRFTFSFLLPKEEASHWLAGAGETLAMEIDSGTPADGSPNRLQTGFDLPADSNGLRDVIVPCLKATVVEKLFRRVREEAGRMPYHGQSRAFLQKGSTLQAQPP